MGARGLATGAAVVALAVAGCGDDEPAPFKDVKQATSTTSSSAGVAVGEPTPANEALAGLSSEQRKALAALAGAQDALIQRGDAVAVTGTDAGKLVQRVHDGFEPPSGSAAPEVRRLAAALTAFGSVLGTMATQPDLLPALSKQLDLRYRALAKRKPTVAAHVLDVKEKVDTFVQAVPELRRRVDDAAAQAKSEQSEETLDADRLDQAITSGADSSTEALNGVNQSVELGVRTLADAT